MAIWSQRFIRSSYSGIDYFESLRQSARKISKKYLKPPILFLSGGLDSELVFRIFFEENLPFRVCILQFKDDLNSHDIKHAFRLCREFSIEPEVVEVDVLRFWENELESYALPAECPSPQLAIHLWMMDQFPSDPLIFGSGDPYMLRDEFTEEHRMTTHPRIGHWCLWFEQKFLCYEKHLQAQNRRDVHFLFSENPESLPAFIYHPYVKALENLPFNGEDCTSRHKHRFYQVLFPEILPRTIYSGFENLEEEEQVVRSRLLKKTRQFDHVIELPANFYRQLFATPQDHNSRWKSYQIQATRIGSTETGFDILA